MINNTFLNIQFKKTPIKKVGACGLVFSKLIIGANGTINACACRDANYSLRIGTLQTKSLSEIISYRWSQVIGKTWASILAPHLSITTV